MYEQYFSDDKVSYYHCGEKITYHRIRHIKSGRTTSCSLLMFPKVKEYLEALLEGKKYIKYRDRMIELKAVTLLVDSSIRRQAKEFMKVKELPTKYLNGRYYTSHINECADQIAMTVELSGREIARAYNILYTDESEKVEDIMFSSWI